MAIYNTNNPLGSADPRDLLDNSQIADHFVSDTENESWPDRFGNSRKTWKGIENAASEAISNIGWQELGDWATGVIISDRRQIVLYDGSWYKYLGTLNHTITGDSPANDGGIWSSDNLTGVWVNIGDAAIRNEISGSGGSSLIGLSQGGTVQNALVDIYVDAFGADNTGNKDSTSAVLAAIAAIGGRTDSAYVPGTTKYVNIIFGNGKYIIGDIPIISGVTYCGKGKKQTQIIPKAGATWCFTVTGVRDYYADESSWLTIKRCFDAGIKDLSIMPYQPGEAGSVIAGVGGVNISYASYFRMENVVMDNLSGAGLWQEQLWDSDFIDVRITACGQGSTDSNIIPSFYLGMGSTVSVDGSNAIRYFGLHLENSPRLMTVDQYSRHIFFIAPKIEGTVTTYTNIIDGAMGVVFDSAELTWQFKDKPMFTIVGTEDSRYSKGLVFQSPVMISGSSASQYGYYFNHSSIYGVLQINDMHAENVKTLATGDNIAIDGGSSWNCGPDFLQSASYLAMKNTEHRSIIPGTATDGTEDFVQVSGGGHDISKNRFDCSGSLTDGLSYLNISGVSSSSFIRENLLGGTRQYGLRQTAIYANVMALDNQATGSIYSLSSLGFSYSTTRDQTTSVAVASDASETTNIVVTSCSLLRVSFTSSTGAKNSSAICLGDVNTDAVVVLGTTGNGEVGRFRNGSSGTGSAGDGLIYLLRLSSGNVQVTNHSGESGTIIISSVDNHYQ